MPMNVKISGSEIRKLRSRKDLTQAQLAKATCISQRQISRWENSVEPSPARPQQLKKLSDFFKVPQDVLTGDQPLPEREQRLPGYECQFNVRIPRSIRNAFTLVSWRYGVSASDVVAFAPLLFLLLAEKSLERRDKVVTDIETSIESFRDAVRKAPHIASEIFVWEDAEIAINEEYSSIRSKDLFGRKIRLPSYWNDQETDPFAGFLAALGRDMPKDLLGRVDAYDLSEEPGYEVCRGAVREFVGSQNEDLVRDVLEGWALLHEMPEELRKSDDVEKRAQWVREQADQNRPIPASDDEI